MRLRDPRPVKPATENMVPLINIVFLILIFFLVAATIRPFTDDAVQIAESVAADAPDLAARRMLVVRADGSVRAGGALLDDSRLADLISEWSKDAAKPVIVVADRSAKASRIVALASQASAAGIERVRLLTQESRR